MNYRLLWMSADHQHQIDCGLFKPAEVATDAQRNRYENNAWANLQGRLGMDTTSHLEALEAGSLRWTEEAGELL